MREMIDEMKETPVDSDSEDRLELATLSFKERMVLRKADFKEKLSALSGKEKFGYILRYYIPVFIFVCLLIGCTVMISVVVYKNSRPISLSYAIVNCDDEFQLDLSGFDNYVATLDVSEDSQILSDVSRHFNSTAFSNGTLSSSTLDDYTGFDMICDEGYYDIIITDKDGLTYFSEIDSIQLLDVYLPDNLREQLADRIVTAKDSQGELYESAIDISDTEFIKELNTGYSPVYIAFPGNKDENYERAISFLEYILDITIDK